MSRTILDYLKLYPTAKDAKLAYYLWYQYKVRQLSEKNFKKEYLENKHLRGKGYSLDHKISIKECFESNFTIEMAADIANLEIVPNNVNRRKGAKSSMGIHEFMKIISERED